LFELKKRHDPFFFVMSLIACPECRKQISDGVGVCPHCGLPIAYTSQGSMPPVPPKEDVSSRFPLIPVDAKDSSEAARQIMRQLNRFRAEGWTTGRVWAGREGRNGYYWDPEKKTLWVDPTFAKKEVTNQCVHMENATQRAILRFDLRPAIRRGISPDTLMNAALPGCTEQKIDQLIKLDHQTSRLLEGRSGCLVFFLALVFGIIGVIAVCIKLFIPFGR
jgi:hypothetical protein